MAAERQTRATDPDECEADYHTCRAFGIVNLPSGETEGLDPREISRTLLEEIGHSQTPMLRVIRAKCLDCSQSASEVRRCTAVNCSLWPYRMGSNPFRAERSDAQKAAAVEAAKRLHRSASKAAG
jgi:hypothetical protein